MGRYSNDKNEFLYELALAICFRIEGATAAFEHLYNYADDKERLTAIRARCCFVEIPDWKTREIERRRAYSAEREAARESNKAKFEASREQVRNGTDFGLLGFVGRLYFALFGDVDRHVSPHQRLVSELGEENAQAALDGLVALVRQGEVSPLDEIVRMDSKGKEFRWWYAVIAGLDEYVDAGNRIGSFSDDYLRSVLAIDCLHPTFWHEGNTVRHIEHKWKQELLRGRPDLVVDAYLPLIRAGIIREAPHVNGLHELMNLEELKSRRSDIALSLLKEFPSASLQVLRYLMPGALEGQNPEQLLTLARNALAESDVQAFDEARAQWLAIGFLLAPNEFKTPIENLPAAAVHKLIWNLRDLSGMHHRAKDRPGRLSLDQLEFLVRLTATHFPKSGFPAGGWSGDTNPGDATEFIQRMINHVSADASERAGEALARLTGDPVMDSYLNDVRHAWAQQQIRQIDEQFRQPAWPEAVEALQNGAPANTADLHALMMAHLADLEPYVASSNTDIYKHFWNEDRRGRVLSPKGEESCRDVLVNLLRPRLSPHGVRVEPEGHMASDKRADIVALVPGIKLVIELKRDYHAAIWTAIQNQLDRFYTLDPEAKGFGIYGVFWYGSMRPRSVPRPPTPMLIPRSATEMQHQLTNLLPQEKRQRIQVFVIDVSSPLSDVRAKRPRAKRGKVTKPQGAKKRPVTKASKKREVTKNRQGSKRPQATKKGRRANKRKGKNRSGRRS